MVEKTINLEYNGRNYELPIKDFPGLEGSGKITIRKIEEMQEEIIKGDFKNLHLCHMGNEYLINGVNIEKIIAKVEAEKEAGRREQDETTT